MLINDDSNGASDGKERGRFGHKVFIAAIERALHGSPFELKRSELHRRLVAANREGFLELVRVDLVAVVDPAELAASEIRSHGSTFHAVLAPSLRAP